MRYSIRNRFNDPIRGAVVKIEHINGELGSGILDKNGKEIFEGDTLQYFRRWSEDNEVPETVTVSFEDGAFSTGIECLYDFVDRHKDVEIIGHVDD